jgi:hypothetical protein
MFLLMLFLQERSKVQVSPYLTFKIEESLLIVIIKHLHFYYTAFDRRKFAAFPKLIELLVTHLSVGWSEFNSWHLQ